MRLRQSRGRSERGFEFIVIDTAGRDLVALPAVIAAAHFMLTPSQPSPLAATATMRRLWAQGTTQAAIVLNCVTRENVDRTRSYVRRYAAQGSILPSVVVRRVQYIDAQDRGLVFPNTNLGVPEISRCALSSTAY